MTFNQKNISADSSVYLAGVLEHVTLDLLDVITFLAKENDV